MRQLEPALSNVNEALALVAAGGPRVWEAELHRLKGVMISRRDFVGRSSTDEAEAAFKAAIVIARRQQAKAFELRAAISLARWRRDQGRHREACEVLVPVRAWFTEGFDTPDLIEADTLLWELDATAPTREVVRADRPTRASSRGH